MTKTRQARRVPKTSFLIGIRHEGGETDYLNGGPGGWFYFSRTGVEGDVWVRFASGPRRRIEVAEIHLRGVSSAGLRELPLGRLEKIVNSPDMAPPVRDLMNQSAELAENADRFLAMLQRKAPRLSGPAGLGFLARPNPFIEVPPGQKRPDAFYAKVAGRYAELAGWTRHPAAEIAEASGVPVTTVQRWMKEARRRGTSSDPARG